MAFNMVDCWLQSYKKKPYRTKKAILMALLKRQTFDVD